MWWVVGRELGSHRPIDSPSTGLESINYPNDTKNRHYTKMIQHATQGVKTYRIVDRPSTDHPINHIKS